MKTLQCKRGYGYSTNLLGWLRYFFSKFTEILSSLINVNTKADLKRALTSMAHRQKGFVWGNALWSYKMHLSWKTWGKWVKGVDFLGEIGPFLVQSPRYHDLASTNPSNPAKISRGVTGKGCIPHGEASCVCFLRFLFFACNLVISTMAPWRLLISWAAQT